MAARATANRPTTAEPLPRGLDNSSGGQTVVPDDGARSKPGDTFLDCISLVRPMQSGQAREHRPAGRRFLSVRIALASSEGWPAHVSGMGGWDVHARRRLLSASLSGDPVQLPRYVHQGKYRRFTHRSIVSLQQLALAVLELSLQRRYKLRGSRRATPRAQPRPLTCEPRHRGNCCSLLRRSAAGQPVTYTSAWPGSTCDLIVTVPIDAPYTNFPGYRHRQDRAHIRLSTGPRHRRMPTWRKKSATPVKFPCEPVRTDLLDTSFGVKAASATLTFTNPDVVPHSWVLWPGQLERTATCRTKSRPQPGPVSRARRPNRAHTRHRRGTKKAAQSLLQELDAAVSVHVPGHWMVMNGQMIE